VHHVTAFYLLPAHDSVTVLGRRLHHPLTFCVLSRAALFSLSENPLRTAHPRDLYIDLHGVSPSLGTGLVLTHLGIFRIGLPYDVDTG
jgi:hypothetical protein